MQSVARVGLKLLTYCVLSLCVSLTQLAKRVGLLQDELESPASKRKSKKKVYKTHT